MNIRKWFTLLAVGLLAPSVWAAQIVGVVATPTGGPIAYGTLTFTLDRPNVLAGSFLAVAGSTVCYLDGGGNVRALPNPQVGPVLSQNISSGTLAAGTYLVEFTWADATGESQGSFERSVSLSGTGSIILTAPSTGVPATATSLRVYIGTSSGTETLQGSVSVSGGVVSGNYTQSVPLVVGAALPSSNTSQCFVTSNDSFTQQPSYYTVSLTNSRGSTVSGGISRTGKVYLAGGPSAVISLANGLPDYNGGVGFFPIPIISTPSGNSSQTINGPLNLAGNALTGVGSFSASGALAAGSLNGVVSAGSQSGSDIGAKVNAAIAALPTTGGEVDIPCTGSAQTFTTQIVINKPVFLKGQGRGTTTAIQTTGTTQTCVIQWGATSGDAIAVNLPGSGVLSGVRFANFTLLGNRAVGGATSGSGIAFNGGNASTQMADITLENITVKDFKEAGIKVRDNVFILNAHEVSTITNVGSGWDIGVTVLAGVPSQIRWFQCMSLQNGGDGFKIVGATESMEFHGTTGSNNTGNGINASTVIYVFGGAYEANTLNGISASGPGSVVDGATVPVNTLFGIDVEGSDSRISGIPKGNSTSGDIKIGAANDTILLHNANNLVITDSGTRTSQIQGNTGVWFTRSPACVQWFADATHNNKICRDTVSGGLIATFEPGGIFTIPASMVLSSGSLTGGASGFTLNAGGSGQNITLTPSGAGVVNISAGGGLFINGSVLSDLSRNITAGTGAFSGVITSTKATGTAPFTITSTTPVANLTASAIVYGTTGTQAANSHTVTGVCTLGTNCAVTLSGSAVYTSSGSYQCTANDASAAAAVQVNQISGTAVTFTGTGTDAIRFSCTGN